MADEIKSVTLSDGRVITKANPAMRDIAAAQKGWKNEVDMNYSILAVSILVDGKKIVLEDFYDNFHYDDLAKITELISDEDVHTSAATS